MKRLFLFFFFSTTPLLAKPLVLTSFSILQDMVQQVASDRVEVKTLVGPNQDPHVFEPRPQHAKELERADLVVVNGLGFEGWLDRLIEASGFQGDLLVATEGIVPLKHAHYGKEVADPHAWHSLKNATVYIDNIAEGLSRLLPEEAPFFKARAKAYKEELEKIEEKTRLEISSFPPEKCKILTNHEAFGYLGRDFGITFYSPLGMSTDSEPSAKAVASLIKRLKKDNIKAVFIENISNPRLVEQIAEEAGTYVGGVLYSDALDAPGTLADSYLKMIKFNLSSLVEAIKRNAKEGAGN